jgi:spore coat protein U-like protein
MKLKQSILAAAMLLATAVPMQAQAAVATAALQVSATAVNSTGSVTVAGPLAFGSALPGQLLSATTSFDVNVTNGVPYTIAFGSGLSGYQSDFAVTETTGQTFPNGLFAAESFYYLWSDSTKATAYVADRTNAPVITGLTGSGTAQTYSLYGEVTLLLTSPAGTYADTITITVTY